MSEQQIKTVTERDLKYFALNFEQEIVKELVNQGCTHKKYIEILIKK